MGSLRSKKSLRKGKSTLWLTVWHEWYIGIDVQMTTIGRNDDPQILTYRPPRFWQSATTWGGQGI